MLSFYFKKGAACLLQITQKLVLLEACKPHRMEMRMFYLAIKYQLRLPIFLVAYNLIKLAERRVEFVSRT